MKQRQKEKKKYGGRKQKYTKQKRLPNGSLSTNYILQRRLNCDAPYKS